MYVKSMTIRNFRNFHKARFEFSEGVNVLIGENGSGKSNALAALRILIDDDIKRNALRLEESDFNRLLPNWRGHWIVVSLELANLTLDEACQILRHGGGQADSSNNGRYTYLFRPKIEFRRRSFEYFENGQSDQLREFLESLTLDNYEYLFNGRASADFFDDAT